MFHGHRTFVHPLLKQNEQRSVMVVKQSPIQVLHKENTNFVMGIDEL